MAIGPIGPLPNSDFSTVATAAAVMQCAHGYSACMGVSIKGAHAGLWIVSALPSMSLADCGDRAPEVISVLGIKYRDVGVGSCHVSECEQPGIFDETELLGGCESTDHRIPGRRASDDPKLSNGCLLRSALRAVAPAHFFDFVIITGPLRALQWNWRLGSELSGHRPTITGRRFPAAWTVEEYRGISYIVRDANRFPMAYVYFESKPGRRAAGNLMTRDEARKIAAGIAKLPELLKRPQY
jgi:hypothetical protein